MNACPPRFHFRALVSVLTGFAFVLLAASGSVLFLAPPGRVANWTNWMILGLRKSEWSALHIWFGAVFLIGGALHVYFNLRPLIGYFKDRGTRRAAVRREWVVAAVLCAGIVVGTLARVPPFESLLAWNESLKQSWENPGERAPLPHAELLTLGELAGNGGVDVATAITRLAAAGITHAEPDERVQHIARRANTSAQHLYAVITTAADGHYTGRVEGKGKAGGGGTGWKTLGQVCREEGVDVATAVARLEASGCRASEHLTLREIASSAERNPRDLLAIVRGDP
jgi:hypothetical protein